MLDPDAYSDDMDDFDDLENASRRSGSPTKMTARQRSKGNKDIQDHLMALPNGQCTSFPLALYGLFLTHAGADAQTVLAKTS